MLFSALVVIAALWLDRWLGEPTRFHPLIGFGNLVNIIERVCRNQTLISEYKQGALAWGLAVIPLFILCFVLDSFLANNSQLVWLLFNTLILYLSIGGKSLVEHAHNIYIPLKAGDIDAARYQVSMIVSRNTEKMSEQEISSSAIESVLENGNDAVVAPIFWFLILGAPGALLFRLINTLDAMWGYKNEQYLYFGRVTAKVDDLFGWFPARITALTYALQGDFRLAINCWRTQARECSSPNGGVVMTAGAGALAVTIGGPTYYHGVLYNKKPMGAGAIADWHVIPLANQFVTRGSFALAYLWLICILIGGSY